jgi:hypothetical protein
LWLRCHREKGWGSMGRDLLVLIAIGVIVVVAVAMAIVTRYW